MTSRRRKPSRNAYQRVPGSEPIFPKNVRIGPRARVGKYAILGHTSSRTRRLGPLVIGKNAVIRSHTVIYLGTVIGDDFETGHGALVRENNQIGDRVRIGSFAEIGRENRIGDDVRIHSRCFIPEFVEIQDRAWLGPAVTVLNIPHPPCPSFEQCASGANRVVIGRNAKVGGGAVIGPWVNVGENALIGAGSVVIRDVPRNAVVVGNPARKIKAVSKLTCDLGLYKVPYEWERRPTR